MGLLDNVLARLAPAKEKVSDLAQQHGGKIEQGLDKAARMADEKTKGKYSDKIRTGTGKAKGALDRIAHKEDGGTDGGGTPPSTPPSPPPTPPSAY
ncbi:antitoxin [Streptomyces sp. CWNU-52B]|uniref:antitoxin n=1 Tax=unclassified Streptomyces TaxID=2593676 RepID=UPI0039C41536